MKFAALITLVPLFLSSFVAHAMASRDVLRARQAHAKRALVDTCAAVDKDVSVPCNGKDIPARPTNGCLCMSTLSDFVVGDQVGKNIADKVGHDSAINLFTNLINGQKNKQQCRYPTNAEPSCNTDYPCNFKCGNGYSPFPSTKPTNCVCNPPNVDCNGACGDFKQGCPKPSQVPAHRRRNGPTCPANDENCGGCPVASPYHVADGKNCKAIPNVGEVLCDKGTCKVLSCKPGFEVSQNGCVKRRLNRVRREINIDNIDSLFNLIVEKGLFVKTFDITAAKKKLIAFGQTFSIDAILGFLLSEHAFAQALDLPQLKKLLELGILGH